MSMNNVHKKIAVYFFLLIPTLLLAQGDVLEGYVEQVLRENPSILASRLVENERSISISLAEANKRATVDLKSDYLLSAGGRGIAFPVGDLFNPTYATLNQLTGEDQFPTNLENVNERFLPSNFHDTRIEARLPLLQPLIGREVALRQAQLLEAKAATAVIENELRRQVKDLYYAYLQSEEGQRIIDSSRLVLTELLRVNKALVKNDKLTQDAVYRTEAELAGLDAQQASLIQQGQLAQAALNRLLGRELNTPIATAPIPSLPEETQAFTLLSTRGRAQRPELRQLDAASESLHRLEDLQDAGRQPTLGAFLNAGAQGFFAGDLNDHPYATVGLAFSMNLYDGKKRNLQKQQTRLQREQLNQQREDAARGIDFQIWQATQAITNERAQLTASQSRARAASASLRIVQSRYRNQNALLIELLDARNELTTAQLEQNLSHYRLLQAYAALEAAVGN
ncbi:MAG: TolC family protein [Bacteroidota bacterium]